MSAVPCVLFLILNGDYLWIRISILALSLLSLNINKKQMLVLLQELFFFFFGSVMLLFITCSHVFMLVSAEKDARSPAALTVQCSFSPAALFSSTLDSNKMMTARLKC